MNPQRIATIGIKKLTDEENMASVSCMSLKNRILAKKVPTRDKVVTAASDFKPSVLLVACSINPLDNK